MYRTIAAILILASLVSPRPLSAEEITVTAVGDVMLAGRWTSQLRKTGYGFPFRATESELRSSDITIANLESPIARSGTEYTDKKFRFRAEPAVAPALKSAGINLVTLANNHSMDFGPEALLETRSHLETAGIAWIGAGETLAEARKPYLYSAKGKTIAFLGYSLTQPTAFFAGKERSGTVPGFERLITEDITNARHLADHVIVSIHWGTEGTSSIQPYQSALAHKVIDAGADVLLGHHPHVLRGIERYKNGIIFYSLGNFVFASKGTTADHSIIVRLRFRDGGREAELVPIDTLYRRVGFQPRHASPVQSAAIISRLNKLSAPLKTHIQSRDNRYTVPF